MSAFISILSVGREKHKKEQNCNYYFDFEPNSKTINRRIIIFSTRFSVCVYTYTVTQCYISIATTSNRFSYVNIYLYLLFNIFGHNFDTKDSKLIWIKISWLCWLPFVIEPKKRTIDTNCSVNTINMVRTIRYYYLLGIIRNYGLWLHVQCVSLCTVHTGFSMRDKLPLLLCY